MEVNGLIKKEMIGAGCFFIAIAAFLYAAKHITAAIMTAEINSPEVNYFQGGYETIGFGMTFWMILSLIIGIVGVISGIWPMFQQKTPLKNQSKSADSHF